MNFWSIYESENFLEYVKEKVNQKLLINSDHENKLSLIKNEKDINKINISKVYSLTFPYINDMVDLSMFLDTSYCDLQDLESLHLDLINKQLLNSCLIENIISLIKKKQLCNVKCLDIIISSMMWEMSAATLQSIAVMMNLTFQAYFLISRIVSLVTKAIFMGSDARPAAGHYDH